MSLLELFCDVDDFCQGFHPQGEKLLLSEGNRQRRRTGELLPSEIMTLIIHFHQAHYRNFKAYYNQYVKQHLQAEFPKLVSYGRFVQLMPSVLVPLTAYLQRRCVATCGIAFIDATALAVKVLLQ